MAIESMEISLIIKGEKISIERLGELSNYGKVKEYHKGQRISKVIPEFEEEVFIFSQSLTNNYENGICEFLNIINEKIPPINLLEDKNNFKIRLYIQTFEAQLKIDISHRIINLLNQSNIDFEISILSWGEVEE